MLLYAGNPGVPLQRRPNGFLDDIWNAASGFIDNRSSSPSKRRKKLPKDAAARYKSSHWGKEATHIYEDPDFDGDLCEMGKLREYHVKPWTSGGKLGKKYLIKYSLTEPPILAFTTDMAERLYVSQTPKHKKANLRKY